MLELLRDPAWQFLGVLLAIIAVVIPLVLYQHQRDRRELAFGVFYETSLLGISPEIAGRVHISFDSHPVQNLRLLVLALKNSGNRPILASDFQTPLTVHLGTGTTILSAEVTRQVPRNLSACVSVRDNELHIPPLLLNPGEYVVIQVLTTGTPAMPTASIRLIGISTLAPINHISALPGRKKVRQNLIAMPAFALVVGVFLLATKDPSRPLMLAGLSVLAVIPMLQWLVEYFRNKTR